MNVTTRLLTTGSVSCVKRTIEQYRDIIDRDYIGVYKKKMDEVYKNPMSVNSTPRPDKVERENRVAFIVCPSSTLSLLSKG